MKNIQVKILLLSIAGIMMISPLALAEEYVRPFEMGESGQTVFFPLTAEEIEARYAMEARQPDKKRATESQAAKEVIENLHEYSTLYSKEISQGEDLKKVVGSFILNKNSITPVSELNINPYRLFNAGDLAHITGYDKNTIGYLNTQHKVHIRR